MASSGGGRVMEKPITSQDQRSAVLRCPRCDSSNTKFCYYNNYSLTQPRHFCKACKRYWTRGGTLRNVPVGGGCRKNKRIKKPTSSSSSDNPTTTPIASHNLHHKIPKVGNQVNSLFFNLPNQLSHDINLSTIPRFHLGENITTTLPLNSSSTSTTNSFHDHHLQPQFNSMGLLGFSSITDLTSGSLDHNYQNRFSTITTSNNSIIPNFSLLGTSSSLSTSTPPMTSSLLASTLNQQQKLNLGGLKEFTRVPTNYLQDLSTPFEGIQMVGNISDPSIVGKGDNKIEEGKNKEDWGSSSPFGASVELNGSSDPSLYWNSTNVHGANWTDLSNNYGSSVTPLI